jgi:hypothetical protein
MQMNRWKWSLLVLPLLLVVAHIDRAQSLSPGDWRTASRAPVGLAPDPATTPEAVAQVYAARGALARLLRSLVADAPSGTGKQFSVLGGLGITAAVEEGIELNVLGMTFGIDPLELGIKLPFAGDFSLRSPRPRAESEVNRAD